MNEWHRIMWNRKAETLTQLKDQEYLDKLNKNQAVEKTMDLAFY